MLRLDFERGVELLEEHPSSDAREAIVQALAETGVLAAAEPLGRALRDPSLRTEAVRALLQLGQGELLGEEIGGLEASERLAVVDDLCTILASSRWPRSPSVRASAIESLFLLIGNEDETVRLAAHEAFRSPEGGPAFSIEVNSSDFLVASLGSPDPLIRRSAAWGLIRLSRSMGRRSRKDKEELRLEPIERVLIATSDLDPEVRAGAVEITVHIDSNEKLEPLLAAIADSDPKVVVAAIRALRGYRHGRALDVIRESLRSHRGTVRRAAVDAIRDIPAGKAEERAVREVRDATDDYRRLDWGEQHVIMAGSATNRALCHIIKASSTRVSPVSNAPEDIQTGISNLRRVRGEVDPDVVAETLKWTPHEGQVAAFLVEHCGLDPSDPRIEPVVASLTELAKLPVKEGMWLEGDTVERIVEGDANEEERRKAQALLKRINKPPGPQ